MSQWSNPGLTQLKPSHDSEGVRLLVDERRYILAWSGEAESLLGWTQDQMEGMPLSQLGVSEVDRDALDVGAIEESKECSLRRPDGSVLRVSLGLTALDGSRQRWWLADLRPAVRSEMVDPARWQRLGTGASSGARDAQRSVGSQRSQDFQSVFAQHSDGVFAVDSSMRLLSANRALAVLCDLPHDELPGMLLESLVPREQIEVIRLAFDAAMQGSPESMELEWLGRPGQHLEVSLSLLPQLGQGRVLCLHGIVRDISHRKRDERRILYLANHDPLTGLPNRNLLHERMQHAVERARRHATRLGVLFLDLNRFKIINDSLGHDKGDQLLCVVAQRLRCVLRDIDTVARIGGDEFVVLLEDVADESQVARVAEALLRVVNEPVDLAGNSLSVSTSVGAAIYPEDGQEAVTLLKNADLAMYESKHLGPGSFCRYLIEMNTRVVARLMRENNLRQALERGEMVLHYQPRLDLTRQRLAGLEALVRWDHPEKGLIYPNHFIGLAEETGMIDRLGEWVLMEACQQMQRWREAGLAPASISVNVSALQLRSERICEVVLRALEVSGLEPQHLELEITESSLMQNLEACTGQLERFRNIGLRLSIDDFGTGYSSLNYLKRLPIDALKIDKSFVRDLTEDHDDRAIVGATIAMAHSMGLRVVAEGVVSHDQMEFLREAKCDEIQGYLFCQPLGVPEMENFFRTLALRGVFYSWAH